MVKEKKVPNIIYIGGSGRSGTNITKEMLGRHSLVQALPFEHRITIDPGGLIDFYNTYSSTWSPYQADFRIQRLRDFLYKLGREGFTSSLTGELIKRVFPGRRMSGPGYHDWRLARYFPNYFTLVDELIEALTAFRYPGKWPGSEAYLFAPQIISSGPMDKVVLANILRDFLEGLINQTLAKYGGTYFAEDNTWNILFANQLLEITPQAKFLHVYRDPIDVVASLVQQRWAPEDVLQSAQWYAQIMRQWLVIREKMPRDSFREIRFESLVENPEGELSAICQFVGIGFELEMARLNREKANIGRGKMDFSGSQIDSIRGEVADIENAFGYS